MVRWKAAGVRWQVSLLLLALQFAGCSWQPAPPPQFDYADFGGTGDLMTKCMQYGSQSYCERQIWGGGGNGLR